MTVKRVMRYLKGTHDYGLWYKKGGNLELKVFTDANWEGVLMTKKAPVEEHYFLERS